MVDHCVEPVKNRIQSAAKLWKCEIKSWKILFQTKVILKYDCYQMKDIWFYLIFTFDRVAQNATNERFNYEYWAIEGKDI